VKEVTKESLAQWIAELESQPHLSLREERYLAVMKRCEELEPCGHNWNALRLTEGSGTYQYCTLCGAKRVAE